MPPTKKSRRALNLKHHLRPQEEVSAYIQVLYIANYVQNKAGDPSTHHQSPIPYSPTEPELEPSPSPAPPTPLPAELHFGIHYPPPIPLVQLAIPALDEHVHPKQKSGVGHLKSKLSPLALQDLNSVLELFYIYTRKKISWEQASIDVAIAKGHGKGHACTLCTWGHPYLLDPSLIPCTSYGLNHDPVIE